MSRTMERLVLRLRRRRRIAAVLWMIAAALPVAALTAWGVSTRDAAILLAAVVAASAAFFVLRSRTIDAASVARHLEREHPDLQDSGALLLADPQDLSPVEQLQRERVARAFEALEPKLPRPTTPAFRAFCIAVVAAFALHVSGEKIRTAESGDLEPAAQISAENRPFAAERPIIALETTPPAYTGLPVRKVEELNLEVAEGAVVRWIAPEGSKLEFPNEPTTAEMSRTIRETTLYRVRVGDFVTPLSRLTVRPDQPPELRLREPPEVLVLPEPATIDVIVEARDDYGIGSAALIATLAAGSGEMVAFREERFELRRSASDDSEDDASVRMSASLDLRSLAMGAGDELYLWAEGFDNRRPSPQKARSSAHVVRIPGERAGVEGLGEGIPVLPVPAQFRSQRQIILDTEKLLEEREQITADEFGRRSNDLGADQRALRLRYGALLGEEFEDGRPSGIGDEAGESEDRSGSDDHSGHGGHDSDGHGSHEQGSHGHEHDAHAHESPGPPSENSDLEELLADYMHVHDSEESATFFTNEVRTTLKAALAAMWDSERRLRVAEPDAALPFEYVALRELKKVQQASRVYVRRVGFEAPELRPERRLTGDADDVVDVRRSLEDSSTTDDPEDAAALSRAFHALQEWTETADEIAAENLAGALDAAAAQLLQRAQKDDFDLGIVDRLRSSARGARTGEGIPDDEALSVARELWPLLPTPSLRPSRREETPSQLHDRYLELLDGLSQDSLEAEAPGS